MLRCDRRLAEARGDVHAGPGRLVDMKREAHNDGQYRVIHRTLQLDGYLRETRSLRGEVMREACPDDKTPVLSVPIEWVAYPGRSWTPRR